MTDGKSGGDDKVDLYERFERAIRTPSRRLLVDAFLPAAESIPSAVPRRPVEEPLQPEVQLGIVQQLRQQDPSPPPEEAAKPQAAAPPAAASGPSAMTLQEEVEEFMNRDGAGLAPEIDPDAE